MQNFEYTIHFDVYVKIRWWYNGTALFIANYY